MHASVSKKPARWLLLFAALAMFAAACAPADDEAAEDDPVEDVTDAVEDATDEVEDATDAGTDEATDAATDEATDAATDEATDAAGTAGGTIVIGDEQEPTILNSFLLDGNSLTTSKVVENLLKGSYEILPDFSRSPYIIDGEAEITEDPFTVTYNILEEAAWNDGTPVSAEDYAFTYETIVNPDYAEQIVSTAGYELITDFEIVDEKTITFNYSEPYAPYRDLFGALLPAHVLEGEDFLTVWNEGIVDPATGEGISSGPYVFEEFTVGQQIRLVRNEDWWGGEVLPEELVFRYVGDTTTLLQQFSGGELDLFDPQPQVELVTELETLDFATFETGLGAAYEHFDFNTLTPGLDQAFVRQAIAYGTNRDQIVETLVAEVAPDAVPLHNLIYLSNQEQYEPHFDQWSYDPEAATALLDENGCTMGGDGIYECGGTRLAFRVGTTGGNERRELTQQLFQAGMAEIGIEITIENAPGAEFFEILNNPEGCGGVCDFDIALFAWVGSGDPSGKANLYGCGRPQNYLGDYCNEEATELMDTADTTLDEAERVELFNQADALLAEDVPSLPLFQQPAFAAWDNSIQGPQLNPTTQTIMWNSGTWSVTAE